MGRGLAEAAGVHLGVPDHFRMQLNTGSMLVLLSLGSRDNSIVGVVTRGGTTFSDAPGMSVYG